jgi:ATPase subunit of ABC transporter with duplicated ATPase domains
MVRCKGSEPVEQHGFKKAIDKTLKWFRQPKIRRKIATEIREIKSRVIEVHERRRRYEVGLGVDKPVTVDPRLFNQYTDMKELVGTEEARDELIRKIMMEENEVPMKQGKIVSIIGFGDLGKTTLANAVYEKIRARFDC